MRRRLALVALAVASLVVIAFIIPLATLLRNQAANRALSAGESDAQSIAATLAVAADTVTDEGIAVSQGLAESVIAAFSSRRNVSSTKKSTPPSKSAAA